MTLFKGKYRVESIRLPTWDYASNGYYFITICTCDRCHLFGKIVDGRMILNKFGEITEYCWHDLPNHYKNIKLHEFVIMPNHFHGIIEIHRNTIVVVEAGFKPASTGKPASTDKTAKIHGLSEIVRAFKTFSARKINIMRNTPGIPVWQHNYYERIMRNEIELSQKRRYIVNNPAKWDRDRNNK